MPKRHPLRPGKRGEEVIGAVIGALVGYTVAEAILAPLIHPLHWLISLIVAMITYFSVGFWYRWRYSKRVSAAIGQKNHARPSWYRRWRSGGRG